MDDDSLLQKELVEKGLADTYMLQNNYKYAGVLQLAKEDAKSNKVGIWSDEIATNANIISSENYKATNIMIVFIVVVFFAIVAIVGERRKKLIKIKNNTKND